MPGPRSVVGVILATTMFLPLERAVGIALHYTTGRAERWGQTLGYLAIDLLQDLWFLVVFGVFTLPLWALNALVLSVPRRRGAHSWWIATLSGTCIGLICGLWPCGIHIFGEYVGAGIYSQCLPNLSILSPGVKFGLAGCLTGLLHFWIGQSGKGRKKGPDVLAKESADRAPDILGI